MKRRYWGILAVVIVLAVIGYWYNFTSQKPSVADKVQTNSETGVTVGKTVPAFTLNSLDGKTVKVGDPGKIYVFNFWATWCPPCRAELPELVQFAEKYGKQVQFYAINIQEPEQTVAAFLQQNSYKIPVLLDKEGTAAHTFRISAIPTTVVVDSKGMIRYRKTGGVTLRELEGIIKELQV